MISATQTASLLGASSSLSTRLFLRDEIFEPQRRPPFLSFLRQPRPTCFNIHVDPPRFRTHAVKKRKKTRGGPALLDSDDDAFDDYEDEEQEEEEEEEGEGMVLPFGKMKEWLEKKPRGFGGGKVYDTSIEEKLLDEMERSRRAQAANINNLEHTTNFDNTRNSALPGPKKDHRNTKETDVPNGVRVRVVNLPKKKNIHRDLKAAFKEVTGMVSIIPTVSGNKKTKDPICKGIAFVDLKSEEDAARFVRQFSGQTLEFGKIQKQIKCQMMNSQLSSSFDEENTHLGYPDADLDMPDSALEETAFSVLDEFDDKFIEAEFEDVTQDIESISISELKGGVGLEPRTEAASGSLSSKKQRAKNSMKKKVVPKARKEKFPKLDIPGSAKRLKIKEKAVLTGVYTKYASQAALATQES